MVFSKSHIEPRNTASMSLDSSASPMAGTLGWGGTEENHHSHFHPDPCTLECPHISTHTVHPGVSMSMFTQIPHSSFRGEGLE